MEHDELVTVQEAAAVLGIGRTTFFKLMNSGKLASVQIGRRRLIARSDIDACIAQLKMEQTTSGDWAR
jgi:excisionase family DNA binding protein